MNKTNHPSLPLPKKRDMMNLYQGDKKSTWEIAKIYGVSQMQVRRWMIIFGIRARNYSESASITRNGKSGNEHHMWKGDKVIIKLSIHGFAATKAYHKNVIIVEQQTHINTSGLISLKSIKEIWPIGLDCVPNVTRHLIKNKHMTQKCSPCGQAFDTEEEYLNHECSAADGAKPTNPDFLRKTTQPNYDKIAESAQKRGEEKIKKEKEKKTDSIQ